MSPDTHKWLDFAQHLGYYISGFFTVVMAVFGLWWHDRKTDKKRITTLERLAENTPTKQDLMDCSDDKDAQHHEGIKDVLKAVQGVRDDNKKSNETNSQQHQDILEKMVDLHQ